MREAPTQDKERASDGVVSSGVMRSFTLRASGTYLAQKPRGACIQTFAVGVRNSP